MRDLLVPKLYLGTHLRRKLCFVIPVNGRRIRRGPQSLALRPICVPNYNLGTSRTHTGGPVSLPAVTTVAVHATSGCQLQGPVFLGA